MSEPWRIITRYLDELARRMYVDTKEGAAVRAGFMRETARMSDEARESCGQKNKQAD